MNAIYRFSEIEILFCFRCMSVCGNIYIETKYKWLKNKQQQKLHNKNNTIHTKNLLNRREKNSNTTWMQSNQIVLMECNRMRIVWDRRNSFFPSANGAFCIRQWSVMFKSSKSLTNRIVCIWRFVDKLKLILLYMNPLNVSVNFILSICFVSALFFCRWCCYKCITNDHGINDIWHQFSTAVDPHSDLWPTKYHTLSVSIQSSLNVVVGIINRSWLDTS